MIYPIFSVRDICNGFMFPFVDNNIDAAKRNFSYAVNNSSSVMAFKPADYELFKIGEFNTETGAIESIIPELVVKGISVFGIEV